MRRKGLLTQQQKKDRLNWARTHQNFRDWSRVICTDEFKLPLHWHGKRETRWQFRNQKKKNDRFLEVGSSKLPGIFLTGSICSDGIGYFGSVDETLSGAGYVEIIKEYIFKTANFYFGGKGWYLLQDNASNHTSAEVTAFLAKKRVKLLTIPANSPDLNPVEHLWPEMKKRVDAKNPVNRADLWEKFQVVYEEMCAADNFKPFCSTLMNSMQDRVNAVIEAKGGYTMY
jgi:transposase